MNNIYIKPEETIIYKVGSLKSLVNSLVFRILKILLIIMGLLSLTFLIGSTLLYFEPNEYLFGWSLIIVSLMLLDLAFSYYYHSFLARPETFNLNNLDERIQNGDKFNLWRACSLELSSHLLATGKKWHGIGNSKELALLLMDSQEITNLLVRLAVPPSELVKVLEMQPGTDVDLIQLFTKALEIARIENHQVIEIGDLFLSLVVNAPDLNKIIFTLNIEPEDIANVIYWQSKMEKKISKSRKFLDPDHLSLTGGIGRDWAFGYTKNLEAFCQDITEVAKGGGFAFLELEAKETEISRIEDALFKGSNHNVIIVGDEGIGKKTIVYGLAKKIYEGLSNQSISNRRVLELNTEALLAGCQDDNELVQRLQIILDETIYAGNVILFINNLADLVSSDDKVGTANVLEVIMPYLSNSNIYIIGTANKKDFKKYFSTNKSLLSHFVKVEVHEPSFDETIRIIEEVLPTIESRSGVMVSYEAIKEAVKLTDKFVQNLPQPQKTINLIDQATTKKATAGGGILLPQDVEVVIENETNIPVSDIKNNEKDILLNLEKELHKRVIGQEEAIVAVANALRRVRAGITENDKPIGSFLFLGPTGVGKTETAKALADQYFGSEESMIRFDMSEFQQRSDIYRLLGDPNDENSPGMLTSAIRERPFSLVLFDEIEKADKDILNLFLQILDEGSITDSYGEKCSFTNTIIIMTSNAGSEYIKQAIQDNRDYVNVQESLVNLVEQEGTFRPELLNRFTQVVIFRPLTAPEISEVAKLMIKKLTDDLERVKGVTIKVEDSALVKLSEYGFDPRLGARPMKRSIQEHLENVLARKILAGEIKKGDNLNITASDLA